MSDMKINEQTHGSTAQFEIRQNLRFVDSVESLHTLQFHHDKVLNNQVQSVTKIDGYPVVNHRESDLALNFQTLLAKFMEQTSFVGTLKQTPALP